MKYANMIFSAKGVQNIGDNIQLIAIDEIYEKMNLKEELVYINKNDLKSYKGEKLILPVSLAMVDYTEKGWAGRFSDDIVPVFLGLSIAKDFLTEEEVTFFKNNSPVGCRDERTYKTMQKYGIPSYFSGCITISFPKRDKTQGDKIFCVDLSEDTIKKLPDFIKDNAIFTTHMLDDISINPRIKMQEQYDMYKNEAKFVVTSLLHCSSPCLAAGIPVICITSLVSYRFSWIDKILKVHNTNDMDKIDWNPEPIDVSYPRNLMTDLAMKRLKNPRAHFPEMDLLTQFWMDRERNNYQIDCFLPYSTFIDVYLKDKNASYTYAVWGLTQMSEMVVEKMKNEFPNSKLVHAYDKYQRVDFYGIKSESSENVCDDVDFIFVTTNGAEKDAMSLIEKNILHKEKVCLMKLYR